MTGHQLVSVAPNTEITPTANIRIEAAKSEDKLTNKRYLNDVIHAFQAKGYHHVGANLKPADFVARINLTGHHDTREEQRPVYSSFPSRSYTNCYQDTDGNQHCHTHYQPLRELIGYHTVKIPVVIASFSLDILNSKGETVLQSQSTVEHETCSRWKLYEFLIQNTIATIDFNRTVDQPFRVEMPEDYQCTDTVSP